jgi:hypothetical protein
VAHAEEVAEQRAKAKKSMDSGDEAAQASNKGKSDSHTAAKSQSRRSGTSSQRSTGGERKAITSEHEIATIDLLVSGKRTPHGATEGKFDEQAKAKYDDGEGGAGAHASGGSGDKCKRRQAQDDYEFNEGEELVLQVRSWWLRVWRSLVSVLCQ